MSSIRWIGLLWIAILSSVVNAAEWSAANESVWDTKAKKWITPVEMGDRSSTGQIWILGEDHATTQNVNDPETIVHHQNQLRLLESMGAVAKRLNSSVFVGMEFLAYTDQIYVDQFLIGQIVEDEFLRLANWGSSPFSAYRAQVLFPANHGGRTLALNAPRNISARVAEVGPGGLTDQEKLLLPPRFEQGNADYYERFKAAMENHVPADKIPNYFWAQSLWDSTMAWRAVEGIRTTPKQIQMIIVGGFHVVYGGGLPEMIRRLGFTNVTTVIQATAADWKAETLADVVKAHAKYGEQADFIWVHSTQLVCKGDGC